MGAREAAAAVALGLAAVSGADEHPQDLSNNLDVLPIETLDAAQCHHDQTRGTAIKIIMQRTCVSAESDPTVCGILEREFEATTADTLEDCSHLPSSI